MNMYEYVTPTQLHNELHNDQKQDGQYITIPALSVKKNKKNNVPAFQLVF